MSRAIWLITTGEPLPLPGATDRLLRTGILARHLVERGHQVTWWTATVDHFHKRFFPGASEVVPVSPGLELRFLPGRLYRRNLSPARFLNHREVAAAFRRLAPARPRPDLILCSLPTLDLSLAAVRFGAATGVPVILDIRDLWPDVFYHLLPGPLRGLGPTLFYPLYRQACDALGGATALVGISERYLEWGLAHARRGRTGADQVFTIGFPPQLAVEPAEVLRARKAIGAGEGKTVCWFAGSFAGHIDLATVLAAARQLQGRRDILFVLSGAGEREAQLRAEAADLPNVRFSGWLDRRGLAAMGRAVDIGIAPYRPGALMTLTNKLFEYMSAGLPVVLGLRGEAETIVTRAGNGLIYEPGNPASLAAQVTRLADDPGLRQAQAEASRRIFASSYSTDVLYPRFAAYLEAQAALQRAPRT